MARVDPVRRWTALAGGEPRTGASISLEVRWFGFGRPPGDVRALTRGRPAEVRRDRYAPLDRDDVGLKLRGRTRVGLKQRRCRLDLGPGLPPAERWSRRNARNPRIEPPDEPWVVVSKRRTRLVVDLDGTEPAAAAGRRAALHRGGGLELVQVSVGEHGAELWSVACETWGEHDRDDLIRLLRWSGVDWAAVAGSAWLAGGYPALLRRLGSAAVTSPAAGSGQPPGWPAGR